MKELMQARDSVIEALWAENVTAFSAFPAEKAMDYAAAVVTVAVGTAEGKAMGFCNYLGEYQDEKDGTIRELYGKQLNGSVVVEVRGKDAVTCEEGCQTVSEVLLGKLPDGIRTGELAWEGLTWEKETAMFYRKGTLQCRMIFTAAAKQEDTTFLDFQLRGVRTN